MVDLDMGNRLEGIFVSEGVSQPNREKVFALLDSLRNHHVPTYLHSVRVALSARELGEIQNHDPRVGVYTALHDIGKLAVPVAILDKTDDFKENDMETMRTHVWAGYQILIEAGLPFSAWIALTHHRYQPQFYPSDEQLPVFPILGATPSTRLLADNWGNLASVSDAYDAGKHRKNSRFGGKLLSPVELKEWLVKHNPSSSRVIEAAYEKGIFSMDPAS